MLDQSLSIIILGLAAWRVSLFVTSGAGPWDFMIWIRKQFQVDHDIDGNVNVFPLKGIGKMLTCIWCFSLWAVVVLYAINSVAPVVIDLLAAWALVGILALVFGDR
jgi:hypothetical protein